tara:strand:- start:2388 stop:2627 length:240 start_codon:yes stop_codon:yes gene_type:complete
MNLISSSHLHHHPEASPVQPIPHHRLKPVARLGHIETARKLAAQAQPRSIAASQGMARIWTVTVMASPVSRIIRIIRDD